MDKEQRNRLKEQYKNRRPDRGIVCWESGEQMWIAKSKDATADYNSTSFQLKLGSWPNRELQAAYSANPEPRHASGTDYGRVQFCPVGIYTIMEVKAGQGSKAG